MTNKTKKSAKRGFTLIELMIVVAIIGILAAVAIPKFADLINKSKEGATKGSLGAIRSALAVYYGDQEGLFPVAAEDSTNALDTLVGKYLKKIPMAKIPPAKDVTPINPGHRDSNAVRGVSSTIVEDDAGGWVYAGLRTQAAWGDVMVNCHHKDSKGNPWTTY